MKKVELIHNIDEVKKKAREEWTNSPRFQRLKHFDPSMPSKKFASLSKVLRKHKSSLLIQLRTEHAPLNFHLHRITKAESPACPNCDHPRSAALIFWRNLITYILALSGNVLSINILTLQTLLPLACAS